VTNIYGSPSNVNGYSLEFVDNSIVPQTVGGVPQGSSFSAGSFNGQNWPLSEIIRKRMIFKVSFFLIMAGSLLS
jgi:hypothetical protein